MKEIRNMNLVESDETLERKEARQRYIPSETHELTFQTQRAFE
jgi:hypothetical protein